MGAKPKSELEAFLSFQKRDEKGLIFFFDALFPSLSYFAYNLLQNQAEAEDIATETFLKAWNNRLRLDSAENLKAFLFHVTKNACIDVLRHRKSFQAIQKDLAYSADKTIDAANQELSHTERLAQIYSLIDILPPKCRQIFTLYYQEGRSYKEISHQLNLSINTVRVQKAKAIALIKSKMILGKFLLMLLLISLKFF